MRENVVSVMAFYKVVTLLILLTPECQSQLSECGKAPLNTKIVGGQVASPGSWPWQVSLQISGSHFCGGSLINNQWVLTAAHCCVSVLASPLTVVLGLQTLSGTTNSQTIKVNLVMPHPNYTQTLNNDICLLKLDSTVSFNSNIRPICLAAPESTFYNGTDSWVTGWGTTSSGSGVYPQVLMEVQVPIVGNRQCNCDYGVGSITGNMICAGLSSGGKDSCQGDSGGPMVSKQGGVWTQSGIVSFGKGCALPNFPGVYTRVSQYQAWINSQITSNQPGYITYTSTGTDGDLTVSCAGVPPLLNNVPVTPAPSISITTTPATSTSTPQILSCGQAPKNTRIGGANSTAGTWPWMVSLQRNGIHVCGGTLVSADSVLSNADCFLSSTNSSDWTAVFERGFGSVEVTFNVTNITLSNLTGSNTANIAVLRLGAKPTLSDYIQPICLDPGRTFAVGLTCWAAGWSSRGGDILQEIQTSVVDCGNISQSICLRFFTLDKGDSGGPIMCKQDGSWFQAAVLNVTTTNSTVQTKAGSMFVFDKLSVFDNFLAQTVGRLFSTTSSSSNTTANTTTTTLNSTTTSSITTKGGTAALLPFFILHLLVLITCLHYFL